MTVSLDGTWKTIQAASEAAHEKILESLEKKDAQGNDKTPQQMQKELLAATQESTHVKEVMKAIKETLRTV